MSDLGLSRARAAVAAVFFANGALFANLVPRYPEIRADLGLSNAALGTAIAAFPLGALVAGLLAAPLIGRFGSARVATATIVALAVALAIGLARRQLGRTRGDHVRRRSARRRHRRRDERTRPSSPASLRPVDRQLVPRHLEHRGGRPAVSWAPRRWHSTCRWALRSSRRRCCSPLLRLVSYRFMLPGRDGVDRGTPAHLSMRRVTSTTLWTLAALGVLAACGAVVEDAAASWGALYLQDDLGTAAAAAGLAFVAFQSAMTIGRLTGDRVVDRFGQRTVVRSGAVLAAVAMALALLLHTPSADADRRLRSRASVSPPSCRRRCTPATSSLGCRPGSGSRW